MKYLSVVVIAVVVVVIALAIWAHVSAAEECAEAGGQYVEVDRRPVTRFTTVGEQQIPYTDWEPVYGCVGVPR